MKGTPLMKSQSAPHLDWPLSSQEKRGCVLRLYDQDVRAANAVIRSSEEKLAALQSELDTSRFSACSITASAENVEQREAPPKHVEQNEVIAPIPHNAAPTTQHTEVNEANQAKQTAEKLRAAIASATAALQALECTAGTDQVESIVDKAPDAKIDREFSPVQMRSRSEGPVIGILCKEERRHSRGPPGTPKRRVSFGEPEPEEEFALDRDSQSLRSVDLSTPWRPSVTPLVVAKGTLQEQGLAINETHTHTKLDDQQCISKPIEQDSVCTDHTLAKQVPDGPIIRKSSSKKLSTSVSVKNKGSALAASPPEDGNCAPVRRVRMVKKKAVTSSSAALAHADCLDCPSNGVAKETSDAQEIESSISVKPKSPAPVRNRKTHALSTPRWDEGDRDVVFERAPEVVDIESNTSARPQSSALARIKTTHALSTQRHDEGYRIDDDLVNGTVESLPGRSKSSEMPPESALMGTMKNSEQNTPRRGRPSNIDASVPAPNKTGRVWRPGLR